MKPLYNEVIGRLIINIYYDESYEFDMDFDPIQIFHWHRRRDLPGAVRVKDDWVKDSSLAYLPLYIYDHGSCILSLSPFSCPWDSGQVGYIAYPKDGNDYMSWIRGYIDTVNSLEQGEIYGWCVEDDDGEVLESCWGYVGDMNYPLEEARVCAMNITEEKEKARLLKVKTLVKNRVPLEKREELLNDQR